MQSSNQVHSFHLTAIALQYRTCVDIQLERPVQVSQSEQRSGQEDKKGVINELQAEDATNSMDHPTALYMHLANGLLHAPKTLGSSNGKRGWDFGLPIDDTLLLLLHRSGTNILNTYDASHPDAI
ncbi:hypothetical protein N7449_001644 [Penicillium cf. viridicatum]|uniref:Uncharacterized protein n=1 Tax=Penicillium cf. viridicatum TaxID=2972119 RepID=A0A9W9TAG3_9EURO|nr:hypothetical protein N7449_001644 [Penicillium cf. viridicatum]